jgi:hypothetical protein
MQRPGVLQGRRRVPCGITYTACVEKSLLIGNNDSLFILLPSTTMGKPSGSYVPWAVLLLMLLFIGQALPYFTFRWVEDESWYSSTVTHCSMRVTYETRFFPITISNRRPTRGLFANCGNIGGSADERR